MTTTTETLPLSTAQRYYEEQKEVLKANVDRERAFYDKVAADLTKAQLLNEKFEPGDVAPKASDDVATCRGKFAIARTNHTDAKRALVEARKAAHLDTLVDTKMTHFAKRAREYETRIVADLTANSAYLVHLLTSPDAVDYLADRRAAHWANRYFDDRRKGVDPAAAAVELATSLAMYLTTSPSNLSPTGVGIEHIAQRRAAERVLDVLSDVLPKVLSDFIWNL